MIGIESRDNAAIRVSDVSFSYGKLTVINHLSLEISRGLSFGLLGANGAGKTTLIRLMVGLLRPQKGSITCLGRSSSSSNARNIGYMPQLTSLYNELTVRQNIDFFAHIYGLRDRAARARKVDEVIKLVDLWPKRNVSVTSLSGGMKQRVSLACAIAHEPSLLFLDEPTVGLDVELRVRFWDYFNGLTAAGKTLVISSHTMDDAAHCGMLAFMREGKVIAVGPPAQLRSATGRADASLEDAFLFFVRRAREGSNV